MDASTAEKLIAVLAKTPPTGYASTLATAVASQIKEVRSSDIRSIVRSLVNLYLGKEFFNSDAATFSRDICEGLQEIEEFQSLKDSIDAILCPRIERFLGMESPLGITAKATEILMDNEKVYYDARVLTDIRAVFGDDVTEQPVGAVITHLLAIHHHDSGRHEETFFALDENDIEQLMEVLERAKIKAETLQESLSRAGIRYLGVD
jgi:hypothetical protein